MWVTLTACSATPSGSAPAREPPEPRSGQLDPSFGDGGLVRLDSVELPFLSALAPLPDGGAVVAGADLYQVQLVRVDRDGAVDPSFGAGALDGLGTPLQAEVDDQGRIWLAGARLPTGGYVLRLEADGTPDPTWGGGGLATAVDDALGFEVVLDPDGGAVGVADTSTEVVAVRFDADGLQDPTFADAGELVVSSGASAYSQSAAGSPAGVVAATSDGRVFAFGWDGTDLRTLGTGSGSWISSVAADADGLWVGTTAGAGYDADARVERWDLDGALDPTWGDEGAWQAGEGESSVGRLLPYPDGRLLVGGFRSGSTSDLWRLDASGARDPEWGREGESELPVLFYGTAGGLPGIGADGVYVAGGGYTPFVARLLP